jgi:hypothetical protein
MQRDINEAAAGGVLVKRRARSTGSDQRHSAFIGADHSIDWRGEAESGSILFKYYH